MGPSSQVQAKVCASADWCETYKTSMMAEDISKMRETIKRYLVCIEKDQVRPSARA